MTVTWDRHVACAAARGRCKCVPLPASEPSLEDAVQNQCNSENHGSNDRNTVTARSLRMHTHTHVTVRHNKINF